ncbi:unnamed protein product [Rotaria sp. Silwood2]|nr:unnamed protein product [Rotaria sp. Silwood2]CAF3084877.1 unnamed protein product [Rotaria sp. Silwood2]CAF4092633.1 unnamed protein product [Rotaria sp. Silwood2]CAF4114315.1 unnamed protein product [Rotaria sp. Silwood2]
MDNMNDRRDEQSSIDEDTEKYSEDQTAEQPDQNKTSVTEKEADLQSAIISDEIQSVNLADNDVGDEYIVSTVIDVITRAGDCEISQIIEFIGDVPIISEVVRPVATTTETRTDKVSIKVTTRKRKNICESDAYFIIL